MTNRACCTSLVVISKDDSPVIAALITSMAALLIQVVAVPIVQARTRRREQWEDAVTELASITSSELPGAVRQVRYTGGLFVEISNHLRYVNMDRRQREEELSKLRDNYQNALEKASKVSQRIRRQLDHVRRVRRKSPYWTTLEICYIAVDINLTFASYVWTDINPPPDRERWKERDQALDKHVATFTKMTDDLWHRMRPPSHGFRKRLIDRIRPFLRSISGAYRTIGDGVHSLAHRAKTIVSVGRPNPAAVEPARVDDLTMLSDERTGDEATRP